ncbi:MAG: hypothetical protein M3R27_02635 [Bacteroidota bacterium]|nr:hypothetical protein [Bacteroidota bacterium]
MSRPFIILLFLLIAFKGFSQSLYKEEKNIETDASFFTSDNQGNVYAVKENEIIKFDKTGKQLYKYSNKNFGNITFVDASNMLRILVFYKDFLQVLFLDNTLTQNGDPVSLDKISFQQAQLVCSSHNSGLWIYDQQNLELVRLDSELKRTQQTGNLSSLLNMEMQPTQLLEYDNKVYLNNPATGILVFDIYGTYFKTIPVKNVTHFQPIGEWVYYQSENSVKAYNMKTTEENEFKLPLSEFRNFRLEMEILMLQTTSGIVLYSSK